MKGPLVPSLSILTYHRVVEEPDPLLPGEVCAAVFDQQLAALSRWFHVLPLREGVQRLRHGSLPARGACVTFDDGYSDNAAIALPILQRHGVPATFFVTPGFLDGGRMWNDTVIETVRKTRRRTLDARAVDLGMLDIASLDLRYQVAQKLLAALKYLPMEERQRRVNELSSANPAELSSILMMTTGNVQELQRKGMEIGAHTMNHPILSKLDPALADLEIKSSKDRLETITGRPVTLFAYPNGKPHVDYRREHVEMVRNAGFDAAFSSAWGVANANSDLYQLPRFTPWDKQPSKFVLRLLHNTFRHSADRV